MRDIRRRPGARQVDSDRLGSRKSKSPADLGASLPAHAVEARIAAASNGDVVLAHINQPHRPSGAGVVAGVLALQRRGARFVQLDQTAVTPAG